MDFYHLKMLEMALEIAWQGIRIKTQKESERRRNFFSCDKKLKFFNHKESIKGGSERELLRSSEFKCTINW